MFEKKIHFILIFFLLLLIIFGIRLLILHFVKQILKFYKKIKTILINSFYQNKHIKHFIKKYPNFSLFIKNRFDKNHFFGLPFSILFLLILYIGTEFIGITDAIIDKSLITQIDIRLSDFFYYFKDKRLINLFLFISYFGSNFIIVLVLAISSLLFIKNKKFYIIGLFSSVFITIIISYLSKIIIERPRPELAIYKEIIYGSPSFYSAISIALYGFLIWIGITKIKKVKRKINLIFLGVFIAFLIGFSRLYLNVNYLSDVISGWFLGTLGLLFGIAISGYLNHLYNNHKKTTKNKYIYIVILLGFLIAILNYPNYYNNISFNKNIKEKYIDIFSINNFFHQNPKLKFTETITGRNTEPINFIFLAKDKDDINSLFKQTGWGKADRLGRTSIKNMGNALFYNEKYNNAPMTPLYWNKKIQLFGFQKLTKKATIKYRHHIRIWASNFKLGEYYVFVGCGVFDDGIKWGITHKIDPDLDKEREFILESLKKSKLLKSIKTIKLEKELKGVNFSGDEFFSDGKAYILKIK